MAHYGATLRVGGDTVVIKKLLICHLTVPNLYAIYISKNVGKFGKWTDMDGWMDKLRGRQWIKGNFCRQLPCRITCTYPSLSCTTGWLSTIGKSKTSILDAVEVLELFESSHTEGGAPGYCASVAIRIEEVTSISGCKRRTLPCVVEEVVSSDAFGSTKNPAANQEKAHFHSFLTFLINTSIDVVIVFALEGRFVLKAGKYSKRKRA
jgi:hypothetical protein